MADVSSVKPDEVLYVITTDDNRLKLIGEELANDTGRAVLSNIYKGVETASELAERMNTTMSVIHYHLERLVQSGLVVVREIDKSSRGRDMKRYSASKLAVLLIPSPVVQERAQTMRQLKKLAFKGFLERILLTVLTFVSAAGLSFAFLTSRVSQTHLPPRGAEMSVFWFNLTASVLLGSVVSLWVWTYLGQHISRKSERKRARIPS